MIIDREKAVFRGFFSSKIWNERREKAVKALEFKVKSIWHAACYNGDIQQSFAACAKAAERLAGLAGKETFFRQAGRAFRTTP